MGHDPGLVYDYEERNPLSIYIEGWSASPTYSSKEELFAQGPPLVEEPGLSQACAQNF